MRMVYLMQECVCGSTTGNMIQDKVHNKLSCSECNRFINFVGKHEHYRQVISEPDGVQNMNEEKKFYYNFCFLYKNMYTGAQVGIDEKKITLHVIDEAKEQSGISKDSCLISVSYLGEMTITEFHEG